MKIVKKSKDRYCMFCKRELKGEPFCEINTVLMMGCSDDEPKGDRFIHQIHLSCGYKFLKKLKNPDSDSKKLIEEIESKYLKELIIDNL